MSWVGHKTTHSCTKKKNYLSKSKYYSKKSTVVVCGQHVNIEINLIRRETATFCARHDFNKTPVGYTDT